MGEHDALWLTGGAGRVDQDRDLIGRVTLDGFGHRGIVGRADADLPERTEIADLGSILRRMIGRFPRHAGGEEHAAGAAMAADLLELAWREAGIGDDRPGLDSACCQQQSGKRAAVLADDHHAIAGPDAQRRQTCGDLIDAVMQFSIGPTAAIIDHGDAFGRSLKLAIHDVVQPKRKGIGDGIANGRQFRLLPNQPPKFAAPRASFLPAIYSSFLELVNPLSSRSLDPLTTPPGFHSHISPKLSKPDYVYTIGVCALAY